MSSISVLLPIYYKESAETVSKCFESIAVQSVKPDEIVCALDNPSTPEIEAAIEDFSGKSSISVSKCYIERNSGLGMVLNKGVLHCSCDYIARMDADDIACPSRLEKERNYLDTHENIDVVGSYISEFDEDVNEIIARRVVPTDDAACKKMLKRRDPINHMTAMYRRESVIKAGNYSTEMKSCEDTHLWVSFYRAGLGFANIPEDLVKVHAGRKMYARRSGKKAYYFVKKSIIYKRKVGLIGFCEEVFQKFANYCVLVIMGDRMRAFVYEKLLRKKKR